MPRVLMCVNDWPEPDEVDFVVFDDISKWTDEEAMQYAREAYGDKNEFYIVEK